MYENLYGIMPAATTPFTKSGDLDETANRQQIRYLIESGVHGVVVGGSTGEGHTLTTDELRRLSKKRRSSKFLFMNAGNMKVLCHALISLFSIGLPNYKQTTVVSQFRDTRTFKAHQI